MSLTLEWIIWDWNGTLLDDVDLCLRALNALCLKRGLKTVTLEEYRQHFTFPVIDYYEAVGFDFSREPFEIPAQEWISFYTERVLKESKLYDAAISTLDWLKNQGYKQAILSAHHKETLQYLVRHFGIASYFESIWGVNTFDAPGKLDIADAMVRGCGISPQKALLVGDTLHDLEVANATNMNCVLIAAGHQSKIRLLRGGVPVLDSLETLPNLIKDSAATGNLQFRIKGAIVL